MSDETRREQLRSVLTDLVNDKTENASVTMSAFLQTKVKDILGRTQTAPEVVPKTEEVVTTE